MKKISRVFLTLFLALSLQARAAHADGLCQAQGPVDVDVKLDYTPPQENTTLAAFQINSLFRNGKENTLTGDRKGIYVGLTQSKFELSTQVEFNVSTRGDTACLYAKNIVFTILYRPEVYVAKDFMQDACRYGVTVMHEKRHVDAYVQSVNDYIPQFKQAIEDHFSTLGTIDPISTTALHDQKNLVVQEMQKSMIPALKQFAAINFQRQAAIDTPENYAHDAAICPRGLIPAFPDR